MVCKFCLCDKDRADFNPSVYAHALACVGPAACRPCESAYPTKTLRKKAYKSARKARMRELAVLLGKRPGSAVRTRRQRAAIVSAPYAGTKEWCWLTKEEKRAKQMEGRTPSELQLDAAMRTAGLSFDPQFGVGIYWADFAFHDCRLIVEVDGGVHTEPEQIKWDAQRTKVLTKQRWRVIRFTNRQIAKELPAVLDAVRVEIDTRLREEEESPPKAKQAPPGLSGYSGIASAPALSGAQQK